jgi:FKBP-type peptidyl-prolyl cis-trans isomerase 2
MKIKKNTRVHLHYRICTDAGREIDSTAGTDPLEFVCGRGALVPGFEKEIIGMEPGGRKQFIVQADDAYGPRDEARVKSLPRAGFPGDVTLKAGQHFSYRSPKGTEMYRVCEVNDDMIVVDSNHPLAGQELHYDVEILAVHEEGANIVDA